MKKIYLILLLQFVCTWTFAQQFTINVNGTTRSYVLRLPTGYTSARTYPVVLNFHGWTSNASQQEAISGMTSVANANQFMVVYPNGLNNSWNAGVNNSNVDDIGFVNALLNHLSTTYSVDQQRIYATGFSMGGYFSYRLACRLSNRITAIAPVSGVMAYSTTSSCAATRPVPVAHFHGTADNIVPYSGAAGSINYWRTHNSCTAPVVTTALPNNVDLFVYGGCAAGTEVRHYRINGAGHTWPRTSINASQEIWNFFNRFTLTPSGNLNPTVSLTSPTANASFIAPASITISASASDPDGTISSVQFYQGTTLLAEDITAPYSFTWSNVPQGTYSLSAVAIDDDGASATSSAVSVTVNPSNSNLCSAYPTYSSSNGSYVVGSTVTRNSGVYECISAARCNGAGWAYAPGAGYYWRYAWTYEGSCVAAAPLSAELIPDNVLEVYPNPANDLISLRFMSLNTGEAKISAVSMYSEVELEKTVSAVEGSNTVEVDISKLDSGVYTILISMGDEKLSSKLVVE